LKSLCGDGTAVGRERREIEVVPMLVALAGNIVEEGWKRDNNSGDAVAVGDEGNRGSDLEVRTDALLANLRKLCRLQRRDKPAI